MTATSGFMTDTKPYRTEPGTVDGSRLILRGVQRVVGVALFVTASGLWLTPGADWSSDVMVMKMGLSVLSLMLGFWLILAGARPVPPEIEIDTQRGELRLVRPGTGSGNLVLHCCRFAELARVERCGETLKFWDENDRFIADVHVTERATLDKLVSGLRAAGQQI